MPDVNGQPGIGAPQSRSLHNCRLQAQKIKARVGITGEERSRREAGKGTSHESGEESGSFRPAAPAALVEGGERERERGGRDGSTLRHPKHTGAVRHRDRSPRTRPKRHHIHGASDTPPPRTAARQPRLEKLITARAVSACDSSARTGRRAPRLRFLSKDLCSATSGTTPFYTCHGDMTQP
ncbi:hypothetical protein Q5P01_025247 [Channa striata]|uniref:Uncharacterized protein n=1 Tax=Channa striata TaxID=64152 RepID=A0AA88IN06_CHASR|nr:hypothetical protein Q5P01_025247 [Channa striata]